MMIEQLSPLQRYERDLTSGALLPDAAQAAIVGELDDLYSRLVQRAGRDEGVWARAQRWMGRSTAPERGLYIWGGVGRGKTHLVDAFFGSLGTGHPHLFAIHNNHVVTHIHVRGVLRLVLAAQSVGNLGGQSAKRLVFGVNDQPIVMDVVCLGTVGFHNRSPGADYSERGEYWRAIGLSTVNLPLSCQGLCSARRYSCERISWSRDKVRSNSNLSLVPSYKASGDAAAVVISLTLRS